jgi:DNA (cytosine-5)-methyltransferase 1
MNRKVISLFCGAGGCSIGFKQAGYDIIYATDIDEVAVNTYSLNFGGTICECRDIRDINFESLMRKLKLSPGELDFLIGGPPCQGFSSAGSRFLEDPRNLLLRCYADALEMIKPKWFLMENVEGLLTANHGENLSEIVKVFIALGYQMRIEKVYAHEYGIPQRRKRVFIVGNNIGVPFQFPKSTSLAKGKIFRLSERTLRDTIGTLPPATENEGTLPYTDTTSGQFERYLRSSSDRITEHVSLSLSALQTARICCLKPGQTMKNIPEHLQHDSFRRRANRRVQDGTPSEKRGGAPSGFCRSAQSSGEGRFGYSFL